MLVSRRERSSREGNTDGAGKEGENRRITGVISLNEQERMGSQVQGERLALDKSMNNDCSIYGKSM